MPQVIKSHSVTALVETAFNIYLNNLFSARLEAHLLESERLLGEISVVIRQDSQKITDTANAIVTMEKAVEDMENELKK